MPKSRARAASVPALASSRAARINKMQSAPSARASATWYGSKIKSLRNTGSVTAARAATRCWSQPWK